MDKLSQVYLDEAAALRRYIDKLCEERHTLFVRGEFSATEDIRKRTEIMEDMYSDLVHCGRRLAKRGD